MALLLVDPLITLALVVHNDEVVWRSVNGQHFQQLLVDELVPPPLSPPLGYRRVTGSVPVDCRRWLSALPDLLNLGSLAAPSSATALPEVPPACLPTCLPVSLVISLV